MSGAKQYERAREHMEQLLRAEEPPEPRWDAIERELFARIEKPAPIRRVAPPQRSPLGRALGFAAAAAAIAFAILAAGRSAPPVVATSTPPRARDVAEIPRAAGGAGMAGDLDFRALRPGDSVETAAYSVSFTDVGSVRWTLLPNSRAVVRAVGTAGVGHVIALERGSVRADVVTRAPEEGLVEAFAVEVDGTRVAVHGTLFTVTRLDGRVEVDVEHGTVAVGSAAYRGATTARLLVGPSRGTFSLDGGRDARLLQRPAQPDGAPSVAPPEPSRAPALPRPTTASAHPPSGAAAVAAIGAASDEPAAATASAVAEPLPSPPAELASAEPASAEPASTASALTASAPVAAAPASEPQAASAPPALTPASVQSMLSSCFARETAGSSSSVRKSVVSTLRISVRPDGSVAGMRFNPPLRPALQACAEGLYRGRFAEGPRQFDIPLIIED
ncbi:FecR domain-containing protein [Sorangium sp. So ce291]|uniref:FecR family protein n=1 Tax=Sorangium sp. So ce291 TaxID=3133294 RepID=UPI003F64837C